MGLVLTEFVRAGYHKRFENQVERRLVDTGVGIGSRHRHSGRQDRGATNKGRGGRAFVLGEDFVVGSQHIELTELQTLRGYMQRWLVASMFRATGSQPVDLRMSYSSEDGSCINFPNFQIRRGFWDMLNLPPTPGARLESMANTVSK